MNTTNKKPDLQIQKLTGSERLSYSPAPTQDTDLPNKNVNWDWLKYLTAWDNWVDQILVQIQFPPFPFLDKDTHNFSETLHL